MLKIIHQYLGQWGPKSHMYDTSHTITLGAKSTPTQISLAFNLEKLPTYVHHYKKLFFNFLFNSFFFFWKEQLNQISEKNFVSARFFT